MAAELPDAAVSLAVASGNWVAVAAELPDARDSRSWASTMSKRPTLVRRSAAGQRPDIGPGRDLDLDVEVDDGPAGTHVQDLEAAHGDRAGAQLDVLALADPVVGALTLDLDRAHR